jgi:predicted nucleic acid-binding protein
MSASGVALVDTNILLRLLQPQHPQYSIAGAAVAELRKQRVDLCVAPRNLVELWVVATRPVANNGLGLSPPTIAGELRALNSLFRLLEGKSEVAAAWETLVGKHLVSGKLAHDAHLVAVMQIYALTNLLTFNIADFQRYSGITVLDPAQFRGLPL